MSELSGCPTIKWRKKTTWKCSLHDVPLFSVKLGYVGVLHQCDLLATSFLSLLTRPAHTEHLLSTLLQIVYSTQRYQLVVQHSAADTSGACLTFKQLLNQYWESGESGLWLDKLRFCGQNSLRNEVSLWFFFEQEFAPHPRLAAATAAVIKLLGNGRPVVLAKLWPNVPESAHSSHSAQDIPNDAMM